MELTSRTDADSQMGYRVRHTQIGIWLASGGYLLCGLRLVAIDAPKLFAAAFGVLGVSIALMSMLRWGMLLRHVWADRALSLAVVANLPIIGLYLELDPPALVTYPLVATMMVIHACTRFGPHAVLGIGAASVVAYPGLMWEAERFSLATAAGICGILATIVVLSSWIAANRVQGEEKRFLLDRRIEALLEQSSEAIVALDEQGIVLYQSPSVGALFGYPAGHLLGKSLRHLAHPGDAEVMRRWFAALAAGPDGSRSRIELRLRGADGSWSRIEVSGANWLSDPAVNAIVANARDIGTRRDLEERLAVQSLSDSLTGLANRALFRDRVIHAMERGRRSAGTIALLVIDLDDFKLTNDAVGQKPGDTILVTIAERLHGFIRPSDTLARLGGDEFALLVEDRIDEISAVALGERLLDAIRPPIRVGARDISMTASIGVAVIKAGVYGAADADELMRDADLAMYAAKSAGRDRLLLFDPAMHIEVLHEAEQRADLERALAEDQFIVQYQPIVDLPTLKLVGVEALVRWQHPGRGLIPPSEFIPLAESTGLIVPLGRWVLQQACAQVARWHTVWPAAQGLRVSVNLSARQFQYSGLVDDVARVLHSTGIDPSTVVLEITESLLMLDTEATVSTLNDLKALGVRLAIDDFGTGYSSLSYLRRFPVDIIKIDRSFVDGITTESEDSALTEAVVFLGRSLRLQTIAEGIETLEQSARLKALGCDFGQGFLFARPTGADEIEPMLVGR
ncbi:MAG: EAL domain-containing protein [Micromonosporaceae bacterium]|nr:EAL domain-containing protein [Micromonosporaceae bacterium]